MLVIETIILCRNRYREIRLLAFYESVWVFKFVRLAVLPILGLILETKYAASALEVAGLTCLGVSYVLAILLFRRRDSLLELLYLGAAAACIYGPSHFAMAPVVLACFFMVRSYARFERALVKTSLLSGIITLTVYIVALGRPAVLDLALLMYGACFFAIVQPLVFMFSPLKTTYRLI